MNGSSLARFPIAIAGVGQTGPTLEDPRSIPELVLDSVQQALGEAGIGFENIDAIVTASIDLFDGLTASSIAVTEVVGAVMKPETRIASDGLAATIHGACQLWADAYETVLIVAHGKASMADHDALAEWAMDPIYLQPLGVNFTICAALQAASVAAGDTLAEERWAETASTRRAASGEGALKPPCTVEDVLESPFIAQPLRREMAAPLGDGACAIVLRKASAADNGTVLTGVGHDFSEHAFWKSGLASWPGLGRACRRAYSTAGLSDPATAFDLLEPSCLYPHEEEFFLSQCGAGGDAALSPRGGLFAGVAPATGGLSRLISAARQIADNEDLKRALVHATWGPAGQGQAVVVLERAS